MKEIKAIATFKINKGKLGEFKEISAQMIAVVQEKDPGTLVYDWYLDEGNLECTVLETYADSDAVLAHISNVGELLGKLLEIGNLTIDVYGNPNAELLKATEGLQPKIVPFYAGL